MHDSLLDKSDVIKPYGETDVLPYYAKVAKYLTKFLGTKEIATRVWIPNGPLLLKRGSKMEPLTAGELVKNVDDNLIKIRKDIKSLSDAASKLTPVQKKIWSYFLPRKLCDFFYATNFEGAGKKMDMIFYDIDRGREIPAENAALAAGALIDCIRNDGEFNSLAGRNELFLMYTGSSFHIYVFLKKQVSQGFYNKYIQFSKNEPVASFTGRWAEKIKKQTGVKVGGGHEKLRGMINIDPSQTPSGKLGRCPFSLHMSDAKTIDGVAVPMSIDSAKEKGIIKELKSYTPKKVLENIEELSGNLPKTASRD